MPNRLDRHKKRKPIIPQGSSPAPFSPTVRGFLQSCGNYLHPSTQIQFVLFAVMPETMDQSGVGVQILPGKKGYLVWKMQT
jgi:hypothetical protein